MFNNIGGRLKAVAWIMALLALGGGVIGFIAVVANGHSSVRVLFWIPLLAGVMGWISSWVIYAIGQIAEQTQEMYDKQNEENDKQILTEAMKTAARDVLEMKAQPTNVNALESVQKEKISSSDGELDPDKIKCPICGTVQRRNRSICYNCSASFGQKS